MKKLTFVAAAAMMIVFANCAFAQVIATYNASGIVKGSDPTSLMATNIATNLTASSMTVAYGHYANTLAGNAFGFANDGTVITSLAAAVSADSYFTVILTPASGHILNISGIDLSGYFDSQTSGTATYYLEASVGNGFGSGTGNILAQWNPGRPSLGPGVINVSGNPAFQNLTGPVELRIYVEEPSAYYQDEVGGEASGDDSINIDGSIVAAPPANPGLSTMGINLTGDWLWTDAIREARSHWATAADPNADPGTATEDSNNWPTEDCSLVIWEGHGYNDGTYALSFTGSATIANTLHYCTILPSSTGTYNAATNTTTATLVITDTGSENFSLAFTNTRRIAGGATNTGITNVHLYRPVSEGSTSSYAAGTLFTNQTLALAEKFSTVRFMWLSAVIDSLVTNWSDRNPPASWNQGKGDGSTGEPPMSYEYMVAYCNATNTDMYLNIPLYATDAFVTDLANLVKYGSDGTNPYTSGQANPVYPPLKSNLHVYLEYSNELWNSGYAEKNENYNIVVADQTANNAEWAILNYDGAAASNLWEGTWRRVGLRALEISNDFRAVYGNSAMPPNANAIVRPLLEYQSDNGQATGSIQLHFLSDYYNNADGVAHVTTPEPVNYFLWGGGGATYYTSNDDTATTVDALFASGIPNTTSTSAPIYATATQVDSGYEKGYGLKRVAYEGGWAVYNGTNGYENTAGSAAGLAKYDPRATTAEESAQTIFQQSGGDLNMFYDSSSWDVNSVWNMTDVIFNLTTPLYEAMDSIASSTPAAITYGNAISGTAATTLAYGSQIFAESTYSATLPDNGTLGWVPLISKAGNYQISLNINSTTSGKYVRVLVDGKTVGGGAIFVPVSGSAQNVVVATVNLTAGQHGLLVEGQYASNNSYTGTSCTFTSVVLTPEP